MLLVGSGGAQTVPAPTEFETAFGGSSFDRGVSVVPTRDGGYAAVGSTRSFGPGDEDIYLVRTDAQGDSLWSRTYGGAGQDAGWSVLETGDGLVLGGFTTSVGAGGHDFQLLAVDSDGELAWSRTYGGPGDELSWALAATDEGGFVLVGETTSTGAGEEDCLLVRVDAAGRELWSRTFGGERGDRCFAVARSPDGGYVLAGQTYSEGAGDRDAYIIKASADGRLEWSRTFGGEASDVAHSVTATADGGFMVTGYTTSLAVDDDDPYLIKITADGETVWTRVLPMEGINHTITGDETTDGGFCLVGFTEDGRARTSAVLFVRTGPDGRLSSYEERRHSAAGGAMGYTVHATADGGCVFTGHATVVDTRGADLLLVKMAPSVPGDPPSQIPDRLQPLRM
jgi:hypothetical protein